MANALAGPSRLTRAISICGLGQTCEEIHNLKLAASILFLAVAAAAQTTDGQRSSSPTQPNEPTSATAVQQGTDKADNASQAPKGSKRKKHKRSAKAESTGGDSNASGSSKGSTQGTGQQNAPETTHQSQPPPQRSKPDAASPTQ